MLVSHSGIFICWQSSRLLLAIIESPQATQVFYLLVELDLPEFVTTVLSNEMDMLMFQRISERYCYLLPLLLTLFDIFDLWLSNFLTSCSILTLRVVDYFVLLIYESIIGSCKLTTFESNLCAARNKKTCFFFVVVVVPVTKFNMMRIL